MSNRPTALGVHIYAGGFTLGMSQHFDIIGQLEEGPWGANTFELNFPEVPHPLTMSDWSVNKLVGKVDVIYANPPCAPWSMAGGRLGINDPRLQFTKNCAQLALIVKPKIFILESVCRAWTSGKEFYMEMVDQFLKSGYAATIFLTNSVLHGAPQARERFHMIAHKVRFDIPTPHVTAKDIVVVRDVLDDLAGSVRWVDQEPIVPNHVVKRPDERDLRVMKQLEPGGSWNDMAVLMKEKGEDVRKWRMIAHRLRGWAPSQTVLDISALVHHSQDRQITLREGARLCGYPDSFIFAFDPKSGTFKARSEDVTQAVIPTMGTYLGGLCTKALGDVGAIAGAFEIIDFRKLGREFRPRHFVGAE